MTGAEEKEVFDIEFMKRKHLDDVILLQQNLSTFMPPKGSYDEIWRMYSAQTNVFSVVAVLSNVVVGSASLVIEIKTRGGIVGHIEDLVVSPHKRNKGIGKALLEKLIEIAGEKECYRLSLECQQKNLGFYQKSNFEISGTSMKRLMPIK